MILTIVFLAGTAVGAFVYRTFVDGVLGYQHDRHEEEKAFMWTEIHRLRAQAAALIGKE